mmetsp:Transcript_11081/g.11944  ORF Transcript_11081/g.11944 Transcript_11081/m.11944 type:complete len:434 (-) Transcript_11081:393-1694(-)
MLQPAIIFREVLLLATEAKGVDASPLVAYAQVVQIASDAACFLLERGLSIEMCVVPFIVCCGYNIQFGVVELIPLSFPVAYRLTTELNMLVRSDREKISSMVYAIVHHLLRMKKAYNEASLSKTPLTKTSKTPRGYLEENYFFKPVLSKWIDLLLSPSEESHQNPQYFLNFQLTHTMDIFRKLSTLEELKDKICFPVGIMGFPNPNDQRNFYNFIMISLRKFKTTFINDDESYTPGHPILIFPTLSSNYGWRHTIESEITDPILLENRHDFLLCLQECLSQVYEAGVVHLDIHLENIFYRMYDKRMEIILIDWNDALFREDFIPDAYYWKMQENRYKYPAGIKFATDQFHVHSINRLKDLLEDSYIKYEEERRVQKDSDKESKKLEKMREKDELSSKRKRKKEKREKREKAEDENENKAKQKRKKHDLEDSES